MVAGRRACIIERFLTQLPSRFEVSDKGVEMHGVMVEVDEKTGKAVSIKRVRVSS